MLLLQVYIELRTKIRIKILPSIKLICKFKCFILEESLNHVQTSIFDPSNTTCQKLNKISVQYIKMSLFSK